MNSLKHTRFNAPHDHSFDRACVASGKKLGALIQRTQDALLAEFRATRDAHEHLLRLALIESEALAWQTPYPHLVFPTLAREKAEAVATWSARQHSILQASAPLLLAA